MWQCSCAESLLFIKTPSPIKWYCDSLQALPKKSLWHNTELPFSLSIPAGISVWGLAISEIKAEGFKSARYSKIWITTGKLENSNVSYLYNRTSIIVLLLFIFVRCLPV